MGLLNATGSAISIDSPGPETVTTLGLGAAPYTVQETGVYRTSDGTEVTQFTAGHRISYAEAIKFGMITAEQIEGAPVVGNPIEGEKLAAQLRAAGYELTRVGDAVVTADDPPRASSTSDPVTGDPLNMVDTSFPADRAGDDVDGPKWYRDIVAKDENAPPREEGETEAAYKDRTSKPAENGGSTPPAVRTNENAPTDTR